MTLGQQVQFLMFLVALTAKCDFEMAWGQTVLEMPEQTPNSSTPEEKASDNHNMEETIHQTNYLGFGWFWMILPVVRPEDSH